MSNKKLNYEYLLKDETQREVIQPFVKMVYGKDIQDAEEATKIFLEHNRKFDIGNEFTVFGDLSYVRDEADVNGFGQLENYFSCQKYVEFNFWANKTKSKAIASDAMILHKFP